MDVSDVLGVLVEEVLRGILLPVGVREVGRTVRYKRLRKSFLRKYPDKLLYVKADSRGRGENEYFHYNEAYLLSGFSFERFTDLLSSRRHSNPITPTATNWYIASFHMAGCYGFPEFCEW